MSHPLFAADHKLEPYWLDAAPYANPPQSELPSEVDVAIVGSGYTGMVAAMVLARAGRGVAVFDAEDAGVGCSSRNGGQCGGGLKGSIEDLSAEYGKPKAIAMLKDARRSLEFLSNLVEQENIDCDYDYCGRFGLTPSARIDIKNMMPKSDDALEALLGKTPIPFDPSQVAT